MAKKRKSSTIEKNVNTLTPLPVASLRWRCDPSDVPCKTTDDITPVPGVVGQDAAIEALRFGLETDAQGQNIFVRGLTGTGRLTLVRRLLEDTQLSCPLARDVCYVHNFLEPQSPRLVNLPSGRGDVFRRRMDRLADFIRDDLGTALSSEGVKARRSALERSASDALKLLSEPFEESLKGAGLTMVSVQAGNVVQTAIFPLFNGKAVPPEEFEQLHARGEVTDENYKTARANRENFESELEQLNDKVNEIRDKLEESIGQVMEESARAVIAPMVKAIEREFATDAVVRFLAEVKDDIVNNRLDESEDERDFTYRYRVNVLLSHKGSDACPIVIENAPSQRNLLGTIDMDVDASGDPRPSHMGIRAGSLLRASGGYLVLEDRDILSEPAAWKALVRVLRTGRLEIAPPDGQYPGLTTFLKPEPIDLTVKVILIGSPSTYALLDELDYDFPHQFKVLADFDTVMPRNKTGIKDYTSVLSGLIQKEKLLPFDCGALAALIEHGARIASQRDKLSARFGRVADIAREAAFLVNKRAGKLVTGDDVREAVHRCKERANLPSRRFRQFMSNGTILIETEGTVIGQINGLAVIQAGPLTFGFPTRITATIGPGTAGVINIERESELSGAIHTKGFYILGGLLRYLLRTNHPLAFDASIAFEQSYGGIDGDSASGAEMCCLLSALTEVPLRQDLAMTGAIDQRGHIMAIGAVNEKIEGYFDVCQDIGLSGTQGVIIPASNAGELMLRVDVVEACTQGKFCVYAAGTIYEAIEILTGLTAGTRDAKGHYPKKSMLGISVDRARDYWCKAAQRSIGDHDGQATKTARPRSAAKRSSPRDITLR